MSLIIATGSNIGNSLEHLESAKILLEKRFHLIAASRIYSSRAVDYENQPDFLNQVLEFSLPVGSPEEILKELLSIEANLGRIRSVPRGPRTIDIDILFWGLEKFDTDLLTIPHPRWSERSFVVLPLQELPFFQTIEKCFIIPKSFTVTAKPI